MKIRIFQIEACTQLHWSHDCFTFKPFFVLFSPSNWHNLLWWYALVWLVACEALPFGSISCTNNIPQNLQYTAIYLVKDLLVKPAWAPGTVAGTASIGFCSKQKCILSHAYILEVAIHNNASVLDILNFMLRTRLPAHAHHHDVLHADTSCAWPLVRAISIRDWGMGPLSRGQCEFEAKNMLDPDLDLFVRFGPAVCGQPGVVELKS